MNVLEKEIEDLIFENLRNDGVLYERGLYSVHGFNVFERQLNLGCYGKADLVGFKYKHQYKSIGSGGVIEVGVFEIKKDVINSQTLMQALRYCKGIERYLHTYFPENNLSLKFDISLIGTSINFDDDFCYITDYVENISVYTVKIDLIKGVTFHLEEGYHKTKEELCKRNFKLERAIFNNIKECIRGDNKVLEDDLPF